MRAGTKLKDLFTTTSVQTGELFVQVINYLKVHYEHYLLSQSCNLSALLNAKSIDAGQTLWLIRKGVLPDVSPLASQHGRVRLHRGSGYIS